MDPHGVIVLGIRRSKLIDLYRYYCIEKKKLQALG